MSPPRREPPALKIRKLDHAQAKALGEACGVGPTVAQVLIHRGYEDPAAAAAFLEPTLAGLSAPDSMADRDAAAKRIAGAIRRHERIVVFGDYDVDGTTAAVILADILEALGGDVQVLCADRFGGGYGLSAQALARCMEASPGLIVTCDCGSSDHERIRDAKKHGIDVVVVDHHLVPDEPLPAVAFLNPHRPDCAFPYKGCASAGLAFILGAAVRAALGVQFDVRPWLDLVALGTVADVAPLDGDNRRLVRAGLRRLASSTARPGVTALRSIVKIPPNGFISAVDIAFKFAPRLNAAGRLGQSETALRLLRARSAKDALQAAQALEQLNNERKALTEQIAREAMAQVESVYGSEPSSGIVVGSDAWHRGVVGITAARLAERYRVPAVVVAFDGASGHGSGRSVAGVDLHGAIATCAHELDAWGGHRAAIGLGLQLGRLEAFRAAFGDATRGSVPAPAPIDVDVELGDVFAPPSGDDMARLEPLGEGNVSPTFMAEARVQEAQAVGASGDHLALRLEVSSQLLRAFAPGMGDLATGLGDVIRVVGALQPDHFRGGQELQFLVQHLWQD